MEIHKPKPVHSWRELATEIGVIVIGVCIALAGEQGVEWLHWQGEVKAARQAIFGEIAADNNAFARRAAIAPCLNKQTAEAARILDDLEAKRAPGHFTVFHPGTGTSLSDSEWQSERSSQSLTHFPRDELAMMDRYYIQLERFDGWVGQETDAWLTLSVLRHPPAEMPVGDILRLRAALATAQEYERLIALNAERQLRLGRQLGVAEAPSTGPQAEQFCTLDYEAYAKYVQSLVPQP